ncbi:MAG: hypothetical protein BWY89_01096 [Bacteroidetes bacterium ADurb.BinA012]|nr:MAG: hypothetical protein BWY89_01096 [Bacteroidetes bacterium ADurb.BinA012]
MPAVLGVDLREPEYFTVCKFSSQVAAQVIKVFDLLSTQRKTFLFIVGSYVINLPYRFRLVVQGKDILVKSVINPLKHGIVIRIFIRGGNVLLDS